MCTDPGARTPIGASGNLNILPYLDTWHVHIKCNIEDFSFKIYSCFVNFLTIAEPEKLNKALEAYIKHI